MDSALVRYSRPCRFFFLSCVLARLGIRHTHVFGVGIPNYGYWTFKDTSFGPPPSLHTCISIVEIYCFRQCLGWRFSPMYIFLSFACYCAFSDAAHSRFWYGDPKLSLLSSFKDASFDPSSNLHTCISLVEVYRFGQCLGWKFFPNSSFFLPRVLAR